MVSEERMGEMSYRVALRSANLLKVSLVTTATMLTICLLALAETTNTAEASSLPQNGKIVFARPTTIQTPDEGYIYIVALARIAEGLYRCDSPFQLSAISLSLLFWLRADG